MENHQRTVIAARDVVDEVACVISFMGLAVGATPLDEYTRGGAQAVLEQQVDRLRDSSKMLGRLSV